MTIDKIYRIALVIYGCICLSLAAGAQKHHSVFYNEMTTLDSMAGLKIDPDCAYPSLAEAEEQIKNVVDKEFFLLTDTMVSKSIMAYNYYIAKKYGNRIQCIKHYSKKDLQKRWIIKPVYKTVWDTIIEEKKDLTGVNFGSNHRPLGTRKPIIWHTRYCYDSCLISLRACSNMDGEDNFLLYTFDQKGKDTLCNVRVPCSNEYGDPIYTKKHQCALCSRVYIKIYNHHNVHFSPGACSAFLIVRPQYPKVVATQRVKAYKITALK